MDASIASAALDVELAKFDERLSKIKDAVHRAIKPREVVEKDLSTFKSMCATVDPAGASFWATTRFSIAG